MKIEEKIAMEEFVLDYLKKNTETSVVDQEFHEKFTAKFGGRVRRKIYGACPNAKAMRMLKRMYDCNMIDRVRLGLHHMEVGFPKWVYSYHLKDNG